MGGIAAAWLKNPYALLGIGVVGFLIYWKLSGRNASDLGTAAVDGVGSFTAGAVEGIGDAIGIPRTNANQCAIDMANGDTFAASSSCPASTFAKYVFNGNPSPVSD